MYRLFVSLIAVGLLAQPVWAKKARLPTSELLAGHWVGWDSGEHFRLDLNKKGRGLLGVHTASGDIHVFRVDRMQFNKFKIRIDASEYDRSDEIVLKGTAPMNRWLDLRFELWRGERSVYFYRISESAEVEEALRFAMEAQSSGAEPGCLTQF